MMSTTKVALVLGAGSNIGASIASKFASKGYRVAIASRSAQDGPTAEGYLAVRLDLAKPRDVEPAFSKVRSAFGAPPSVVIFNASSRTLLPPEDPLADLAIETIEQDFAVNATSALVSAQCAVKGFKELPAATKKTFIYTGAMLNVMPRPDIVSYGMGKTAGWIMIPPLAKAYASIGARFYWADERKADGMFVGFDRNGPAHAELFVQLAEQEGQGPWDHTFVKGQGYTKFPGIHDVFQL